MRKPEHTRVVLPQRRIPALSANGVAPEVRTHPISEILLEKYGYPPAKVVYLASIGRRLVVARAKTKIALANLVYNIKCLLFLRRIAAA
jgi:hypothetical protein